MKYPNIKIAISTNALKSCWAGNTIGLPLINPCSFPKAIKLPVRVRVPINTDKIIVTNKNVLGDWSYWLKNSALATRADAPPPKPLNIATICGICVISILWAIIPPITLPIRIAIPIILKSSTSPAVSVAIMAMSIPNEAIPFPLRAVRGWLSIFIPKIKQTAPTTYAIFINSILPSIFSWTFLTFYLSPENHLPH